MNIATFTEYAHAFADTIGGTAAIVNILGIVALAIWKKYLDTAKAEEIARLKATIDSLKHEREVRFATLYARREELLRDMCKDLNLAVNACINVTNVFGEQHLGEALDRLRGLHVKIFDVAIYFDDQFCERWHVALSNAERTLVQWQALQSSQRESAPPPNSPEQAALHRSIGEYLEALGILRRDLVNHARALIGVEASKH